MKSCQNMIHNEEETWILIDSSINWVVIYMCVFCCLMVVTVCWQNHPSHPYIFPWILFRITLKWPLFMIFIFSPLCLPQTGLCLRAWMWSEMTNTIKKNTSRAQHSWVKPRHALPQPSFENVISQPVYDEGLWLLVDGKGFRGSLMKSCIKSWINRHVSSQRVHISSFADSGHSLI